MFRSPWPPILTLMERETVGFVSNLPFLSSIKHALSVDIDAKNKTKVTGGPSLVSEDLPSLFFMHRKSFFPVKSSFLKFRSVKVSLLKKKHFILY